MATREERYEQIRKTNSRIARLQMKRDTLITQAIRDFSLNNYCGFQADYLRWQREKS